MKKIWKRAAALALAGAMAGSLGGCGQGKRLAAICAAPSVLGGLGVLEGKQAVCFPGFEEQLKGAEVLRVPAVTSDNVTTGRGMGAAVDFALEVLKQLQGADAAAQMAEKIVYPYA